MKFRSLVVAFASALLVGMTACAPPTTTPTETSTVDVTFGPDQGTTRELPRCDGVAQTFTAGRSGQLDKVSLHGAAPAPFGAGPGRDHDPRRHGPPDRERARIGNVRPAHRGLIDIELDVARTRVAVTGYAIV